LNGLVWFVLGKWLTDLDLKFLNLRKVGRVSARNATEIVHSGGGFGHCGNCDEKGDCLGNSNKSPLHETTSTEKINLSLILNSREDMRS
jgi:hypothetical protein